MSSRKSDRDRLVEANQKLAFREAHRVHHQTGLELEDLQQVALMGLTRAAEKFNPALGLKFSTYAVPHCRGAVLSYVRAKGFRIYTPVRWREAWSKGKKLLDSGLKDSDVAARLDMPVERWREIRESHTVQFAPVKETMIGAEQLSLDGLIDAEAQDALDRVDAALNALPARQRYRLLRWVGTNSKLVPLRGRKPTYVPRQPLRSLVRHYCQGEPCSFNRADLVERLSLRFPHSKTQLEQLVAAMVEEMAAELAQGNTVRFRGLGSLTLSPERGGFRAESRLKAAAKLG